MPTQTEKSAALRALHKPGAAFIIANAFDAGSARVLQTLGYKAIATTSSGFALTLGRRDYGVTREEAIEHGRTLASAVDLPVSADLENGFGLAPADAAITIAEACAAGLAGGSIEDSTGDKDDPIIDGTLAAERIAAAVEAAKQSTTGFVLTARAEGFLWGRNDLDDVIARLLAFEKAGADVLFAPGLPDLEALKTVCEAVSKPVNALPIMGLAGCTGAQFAAAGAARISLGGALAFDAYGALAETASAILESGTFDALSAHASGGKAVKKALS